MSNKSSTRRRQAGDEGLSPVELDAIATQERRKATLGETAKPSKYQVVRTFGWRPKDAPIYKGQNQPKLYTPANEHEVEGDLDEKAIQEHIAAGNLRENPAASDKRLAALQAEVPADE